MVSKYKAQKRKNKMNATRVCVDGIFFHSKDESIRYGYLRLLEKAGEIKDLELQPKFTIFINNIKVCDVILDFKYFSLLDNQLHYEDFKGYDTDMSRLKRKLVEAQYNIKVEVVKK